MHFVNTRNNALLILALLALPTWAAQNCVASSIDQVGKCYGRSTPIRRAIDRELRGVEPTQHPAPFDIRLLAIQIAGDFAVGELAPIAGGSQNEWMFLIHQAELDKEGKLVPTGRDYLDQLAWVQYRPPVQSGAASKSNGQRPVVEVKAITKVPSLLPPDRPSDDPSSSGEAFPGCITPEVNGEGQSNEGGTYNALAGNFRWLRLSPQHRVLAAELAGHEAYAGGGGTFSGEVLLQVKDGTLVPVACYALSRYQMFGGEWNPDGTRQHPESHAAWKLNVLPGGRWPELRLLPTTPTTPAATMVWDGATEHYVAVRHRQQKTRQYRREAK